MKNKFVLPILIIAAAALASFIKIASPSPDKKKFTDRFIECLFTSPYPDSLGGPKYPDSTVKFERINSWKNKYTLYAQSQCYGSPAFLSYRAYYAIDTSMSYAKDHYGSNYYNKGFLSDFKSYF